MFIVLLDGHHLKHTHKSLFRATLILLVPIQFSCINAPKEKTVSLLSNNHKVETSLFNFILSFTFIQHTPHYVVQLRSVTRKNNLSNIDVVEKWMPLAQIRMRCNT